MMDDLTRTLTFDQEITELWVWIWAKPMKTVIVRRFLRCTFGIWWQSKVVRKYLHSTMMSYSVSVGTENNGMM